MIESEYKYRLRDKTATWGIAIDLIIAYEKNLDLDKEKGVILNYDDTVFLNSEEKEIIKKALFFVNKQNSANDSFHFFVKSVIFNDCDFQKEGLFFATVLWATSHFSFEKPSSSYTFNKKDNLYVFDFLKE
ncbi:hypothetical protein [Aquimarina sp. 2201CG5-10]|uniref:hypothetical protein n=1 Tax=Aquimarina callyspongiae TaxID=3098150 RepID=UPI002AB58171|nr:hypothetical protein [Aquimarina sp. 2201CG5-10]MDY8138996.1 hypothetical protein [Aquimarina sp. 2201CG5-10]